MPYDPSERCGTIKIDLAADIFTGPTINLRFVDEGPTPFSSEYMANVFELIASIGRDYNETFRIRNGEIIEEDYSDIDGTTVAEIIEKWKRKGHEPFKRVV